jgi:Holliday junction resolvasome RuvABC ATP-dependent DNA helicase subunit
MFDWLRKICGDGSMQKEISFFRKGGRSPSAEDRKAILDPKNPKSPYFGFLGNDKIVNRLIRIDFEALGRYNHLTNDLNIALFGSAGCGKTQLARRHNKARGLPFVEITPKAVRTNYDIFEAMKKAAVQKGIGLVEWGKPNNYVLPPMDVFIDEVHALPSNIIQGLLKATEHDDGIFITEGNRHRGSCTIDCHNVHWIIATTDRGKLFDAFDTRFVKLALHMYSQETVAQIVHTYYPTWDIEVCRRVAHYSSRVPREALAFAREMELEYNMTHADWKAVAAKVAADNDVDEYGMTFQRLSVLRALAGGHVASNRLALTVGVRTEEMDKYIMPWLMESTDDQTPMVQVTSKGYSLTASGMKELEKRGIPYNSEEAA